MKVQNQYIEYQLNPLQMGGVAAILVLPASLIVASLVSLPLYLHTSLEKDERVTALLEIASRYVVILRIYHRYLDFILRRYIYFSVNEKTSFSEIRIQIQLQL